MAATPARDRHVARVGACIGGVRARRELKIGGRLLLMVKIAVLERAQRRPPVGWLRARFTVTELAVWDGLGRIVTLNSCSVYPAGRSACRRRPCNPCPQWRCHCWWRNTRTRSRSGCRTLHVDLGRSRGRIDRDGRRQELHADRQCRDGVGEFRGVAGRMFVAVAVTQVFAGRLLDGAKRWRHCPWHRS